MPGATADVISANRAFAWSDVQRGRDPLARVDVFAAPAEAVRQLEKNPMDLFGLLRFEFDQLVVDLHRRHRLEVQRGPAGGAAVHQARKVHTVLGLHQQHEAPVALGDDLVLEVFRRLLAAQVRLERAPQSRPLFPQPIAQRREERAGVILHVAGRRDAPADVGDLVFEGRRSADQAEQTRKLAAGTPDRGDRRVDRLEVVGEREKARGLERAAVNVEECEQLLQVLRGAQGEDRVVLQVSDGLGGRLERAAHDGGVRHGGKRVKANGARRREGEAPHGGDNPVELEGLQGAGIHAGCANWRSRSEPPIIAKISRRTDCRADL